MDHLRVRFEREAHRITGYLLTCVTPLFLYLSPATHFTSLFYSSTQYPVSSFLPLNLSFAILSEQISSLTPPRLQHRIPQTFAHRRTHSQHCKIFSSLSAMAAAAKAKPEGLLGLSQNEARIILLGVLYTDASGKVSYA